MSLESLPGAASRIDTLQGPARSRVLSLIALMVLVHLPFTGGRVAVSLYAIHLHASTLVVGALVAMLSIVPVVLSVHMGRWTDRVGIAKPAMMATVGVLVGVLLPAVPLFQGSIAALGVASMLLGTSFMLMHIGVNNAVGHAVSAPTRTQAFTWLAIGFSLSSIGGPVVAGYAIDHFGYAKVFVVLALFPLLPLVALLVRKPDVPAPLQPIERHADAHVMDLLRDKPMRSVFIASALMSVCWDMFTFMVPLQGVRIGLSASSIGLVMGSFGVATILVRVSMPWITRHLTEWRVLSCALACAALSYALFPLVTAFPLLLALAFFLGLGLGAAQPMVLSLIHQTAPAGRTGEAIGVRTSFLNLSQVLMPLALGAFSAAMGMVPSFWLIALLGAGGSWFTGKKRKP